MVDPAREGAGSPRHVFFKQMQICSGREDIRCCTIGDNRRGTQLCPNSATNH